MPDLSQIADVLIAAVLSGGSEILAVRRAGTLEARYKDAKELVTAAEIAVRTKRSRENVRQLFEGLRGRGDFPRPTVWLSDRTRLWHWAEVSRWFSAHTDEEVGRDGDASVFVVINALLTLRRFLTSRHGSQSAAADRASLVSAWSELGSWVLESTPPRGRGNAGASSLRRFLKNFG